MTSSHWSPESRNVPLAQWSNEVDSPNTPPDIPNSSIAYNAPYPRPASNVQSSMAEGNLLFESEFLLFLIPANSLETLSIGLFSAASSAVESLSVPIFFDPIFAPTGHKHMKAMLFQVDEIHEIGSFVRNQSFISKANRYWNGGLGRT